jgi:hypothetical protein
LRDLLFSKPRAKRVQGLSIKSGPTESGIHAGGPIPVGEEMFAADKLSIFFSNYWTLLVLLLLTPLAALFCKKRDKALKLLTPLTSRLPL